MTPPGDGPASSRDVANAALDLMAQAGVRSHITVIGTSMLPLLRAGDRIEVQHGLSSLRRGDLVVFRQGDGLVVHRLLALRHTGTATLLLAKGDNRLRPDPPVPSEDVIGRVVSIERGARVLALDSKGWRLAGWLTASASLFWLRCLPLLYVLPFPRFLRSIANRIR